MADMEKAHYLKSEAYLWSFSIILLLTAFGYSAADIPLPDVPVQFRDRQSLFFASMVILIFGLAWLNLECRQHRTILNFGDKTRVLACALLSGFALVTSYRSAVVGTHLEEHSVWWLIASAVLGFLLGVILSVASASLRLVREEERAKTLGLPRIPRLASFNFVTSGFATVLILLLSLLLLFALPTALRYLAVIVGLVASLWSFIDDIMCELLLEQDTSEESPSATTLENFVDQFDYHEEMREVAGKTNLEALHAKASKLSPQERQKVVSQHAIDALLSSGKQRNYRVKQLETVAMRLTPQAENSSSSGERYAWEISKSDGDPETLAVELTMKDTGHTSRLHLSINKMRETGKGLAKDVNNNKPETILEIMRQCIGEQVDDFLRQQTAATDPTSLIFLGAIVGDIDMVRKGIDGQGEINAVRDAGWTALLHATANGHYGIVKLLLEQGANPDLANLMGYCPITYCGHYGNTKVAKLLLSYGVNVNAADSQGFTALHMAAAANSLAVAKLLVGAGIDIAAKNVYGETAIDVAHKNRNGHIAKYLRTLPAELRKPDAING